MSVCAFGFELVRRRWQVYIGGSHGVVETGEAPGTDWSERGGPEGDARQGRGAEGDACLSPILATVAKGERKKLGLVVCLPSPHYL